MGDANGIFRTDEHGEIRVPGLKPGKSVIVTETRAPDGYLIDTQSQTVQIKEGRTVSLTFKNQPKGKLIIQKRDSATGQPLPGAEFRVTTAAGCEVGLDGVSARDPDAERYLYHRMGRARSRSPIWPPALMSSMRSRPRQGM